MDFAAAPIGGVVVGCFLHSVVEIGQRFLELVLVKIGGRAELIIVRFAAVEGDGSAVGVNGEVDAARCMIRHSQGALNLGVGRRLPAGLFQRLDGRLMLSGPEMGHPFLVLTHGDIIPDLAQCYWQVDNKSDALHDLGDTLSLGLARYGDREADNRFSYGYQRFSLLGALVNTVVLIAGTGFILSKTIPRLLAPEQPDLNGMLLFALAGILVNGLAAWRMQRGSSLNEKVVAWHLLEDVLGWAAVLSASLVMRFVDLPILDPIISLLITIYVLYNMVGYLRQTAVIFLQAVPSSIDLPQLENRLLAISEVESIHRTHLWLLDGEHHVLSTHLVVPATADRAIILRAKQAVQTLVADYDIGHVTVEVKRADEPCLMALVGREEAR